MAEVTVAFQVCSESINAAVAGLRRIKQHDLADMLRVVQTNEQEKLRLTLILQALQQSYAQGNFSWVSRQSAGIIQTESGAGNSSVTAVQVFTGTKSTLKEQAMFILCVYW